MDKTKDIIKFPENIQFKKYLIKEDMTQIAINLGVTRNYIYKILGGTRAMPNYIKEEILRFKKINEEVNMKQLKGPIN